MLRHVLILLTFLLCCGLAGGICAPADSQGQGSACAAQAAESTAPLRITVPEERAEVAGRTFVEGRVNDPQAGVWVVVHPMEVADYWVQQLVTVGENGIWGVQISIGRPGDEDVGKRFEIRAVANPKATLQQGERLRGWPDAQWYSQVVRVTRE